MVSESSLVSLKNECALRPATGESSDVSSQHLVQMQSLV